MATSVSSERAFSSAGITITKRRNRLKGDIVEALQVLKSAFRNSLFLREPGPSTATEVELEQSEDDIEDVDDVTLVVELDTDAEDDGNDPECI